MKQYTPRRAQEKNTPQRRHRRRQITRILAMIVVFCTTYALILPAITLETPPLCDKSEHVHTEECYTQRLTQADPVLICGLEEGEILPAEEPTPAPAAPQVPTPAPSQEAHVHTEECYELRPVATEAPTVETYDLETDAAPTEFEKVLICGLSTEPVEEPTVEEPAAEEPQVEESRPADEPQPEPHHHGPECYEVPVPPEEETALTCPLEEGEGAHTHSEDQGCYDAEGTLICTLEESEGHVHGPLCYGVWDLTCGLEEHVHGPACFADGIETAEIWEATLPELIPEQWDEALVAVAESQLGYKEVGSEGYTRYGEWYGAPHDEWDAMFLAFCLQYAGVPAESFPRMNTPARWVEELQGPDCGLYRMKDEYAPKVGDLVFFDRDADLTADHVGLVTELSEESYTLTTIEGDVEDSVQQVTYSQDDEQILGYGELPSEPRIEYYWNENGVEVTAALPEGTELPEGAQLVVRYLSPMEAEELYGEWYTVLRETIQEEGGADLSYFDLYKIYFDVDGREFLSQSPAEITVKLLGGEHPIMAHTLLLYDLENEGGAMEMTEEDLSDRTGTFTAPLSTLCGIIGASEPFPVLLTEMQYYGESATIEHHKTIDAFRDGTNNPDTDLDDKEGIDKTDLHRLYLDAVLGEENTPVDLLIVVDQSGSMHMNYGWVWDNYSEGIGHWEADTNPYPADKFDNYKDMMDGVTKIFRDEAVRLVLNGTYDPETFEKNKTKGLIYEFLQMNTDNQVAVVGFQGEIYSGNDTTGASYTPNTDAVTLLNWTQEASYVNTQGQIANSTNYCAGFLQANDLLNAPAAQNNHKKVMLFLSDGVPTVYLEKDTNGDYWKWGVGNTSGNVATYKSKSEAYYMWLKGEHPDLLTYTIGISDDINGESTDGEHSPEVLKYMADNGGGEFIGVESTEDLKAAIKQIITSTSYSALEITDELSEYVDLYVEQPDYKVTMKKGDEEIVLCEKGVVTEAGKGKLKEVAFDSNKTVKAIFEPTYQLEGGWTYTLSFNVKTTEKAYKDYTATKSYPDTGNPETDYGTNVTSSNQPGYHSNNEATLKYTCRGQNTTKLYPHPVVQVTPQELIVEKQWFAYDGVTNITHTKNGSIDFKLIRTAYPVDPPAAPETRTVNVQSTNGFTTYTENIPDLRNNANIVDGSEVTLTFQSPAEKAELKVTVGLTSVDIKEEGKNKYSFLFKVSEDTKVVIQYPLTFVWEPSKRPTDIQVSKVTPPPEIEWPSEEYKYNGDEDGIYTLSSENGWKMVFEGLLKKGEYITADGKKVDVYYTYTVEETVSVDGYTTTYENNGGIVNGTIIIKNTSNTNTPYGVELPETGGAGTDLYTMGGGLMIAVALLLLYEKKRYGKGAPTTP